MKLHSFTRLLACVWFAAAAWSQDARPPDGEPPDDLPSLDELLGLEEMSPRSGLPEGAPGLVDPTRADLDRRLTAAEVNERFQQAAQLMGDAAVRMTAGDAGVQTQRLQEEILRKLDQVIAAAEQQQNQSSSSRNQQQQQQQSQQQQQQRQQQQQSNNPNPENAQDGPARQDGDLSPVSPANTAAWGRLPERTRDALIEGLSERYSSLYERMTEAYYRRLAEDRP